MTTSITIPIIIMVIWGLLAAMAAIGAAIRVQRKHEQRAQSATASANPQPLPTGSIQEAESPIAQQSIAHPDRDLTAVPSEPIVLSPVLPVMPPDVPLATSLSVGDVVQPLDVEIPPIRDAIAGEQSSPDETDAATSNHPTVLEEIAELGRAEQQGYELDRLAQQLHHPDSEVRVAVAFALGELAARRSPNHLTEIIHLLNQLNQDTDLLVRQQATAILAGLESSIS